MTYKVGIVGSRRRIDRESVVALVNALPAGTIVVSGGCVGVDSWAVEAAKARGLKYIEHLPKLKPGMAWYEKTKEYYARNELIVLDSDVVAAFVSPDRKGGTENTIKWATKHSVPVILK